MLPRHVLVAALAVLAAAALVEALASTGSTLQGDEAPESVLAASKNNRLSRSHRDKRQAGRNTNIFGLLFQLIGETRRDIQRTFNEIARQVESSIADENTIDNSTTAEPREGASSERPRVTRQELTRILGRNWRGLTRLFNQEVEIAVNQSNKSTVEARRAFWDSLAPFLQPATTTARSNTTTSRSG